MQDGWVTPYQAAQMLHLPSATIHTWMGRGWLDIHTTHDDQGAQEWISYAHALAIKTEQNMIFTPTTTPRGRAGQRLDL